MFPQNETFQHRIFHSIRRTTQLRKRIYEACAEIRKSIKRCASGYLSYDKVNFLINITRFLWLDAIFYIHKETGSAS